MLGSSLADRDGILERVVCRRVAFSSRRRVGFIERDFTPVYLRQRNAREKGEGVKRESTRSVALFAF